ncbi:MAG: hypothetical protein ACRDLT_02540 [Solirubrobacteraceae bacterium]
MSTTTATIRKQTCLRHPVALTLLSLTVTTGVAEARGHNSRSHYESQGGVAPGLSGNSFRLGNPSDADPRGRLLTEHIIDGTSNA